MSKLKPKPASAGGSGPALAALTAVVVLVAAVAAGLYWRSMGLSARSARRAPQRIQWTQDCVQQVRRFCRDAIKARPN